MLFTERALSSLSTNPPFSQASHTKHKMVDRLKLKQDDACLSEELQSSVWPSPRMRAGGLLTTEK
jgi:hypothetical protein